MSTSGSPNVFGNHIGTPEMRKTTAMITIAQKYSFWPALKKSTYSGSTVSALVTYSLARRVQRRSSAFHVIGASQFRNCSAKNRTNPRLNHGCTRRVLAPPPESGVNQWDSHGGETANPDRTARLRNTAT